MTDAVAPSTLWAMCPASVVEFWACVQRVGREGNAFPQPAGAERVVRQAKFDGVPWAV